MELSLFLGKVLGFFLVIKGLAGLVHRKQLSKMVNSLLKNEWQMLLMGFCSTLLGLLIVLSHNIWAVDWRAWITVIGWLMLVEGLMIIFFPAKKAAMMKRMMTPQVLMGGSVVVLVIGLWILMRVYA